MKTSPLSRETVKKLISDLEEQISAAEDKVRELKEMKAELESHLGESNLGGKSPVRRLPRGLPEKLVRETLSRHKRLAIGEIMHLIKEERDYVVKDGSTRRALQKLIEAELVKKTEDGTYIWLEGQLL